MAEPDTVQKKVRSSRRPKVGIAIALLIVLVGAFPSFIVFAVGMAPTLLAIGFDQTREKTLVRSVAAMNVAGTSYFLVELWLRGHNYDTAIQIATNLTALGVMYGAAAMGFLIYMLVPGIWMAIAAARNNMRSRELNDYLAHLESEWDGLTAEISTDDSRA